MYKDKDKQREANRKAKARQRAKGQREANSTMCKRLNKGMTKEGMTVSSSDTRVIPEGVGVTDKCYQEAQGIKHALNEALRKPKRGKDIKCFADLPPDVQRTIDRMSTTGGKIDKDEKAKRTAAAIKYQHLFPDSYEPQDAVCSGVVTGKPGDADYNGICTPEWRAERGR